MKHYTDEMVEEVARALWASHTDDDWFDNTYGTGFREVWRKDARAVLDAVAPAIAARSLRDAAVLVEADAQFEGIRAQRVIRMSAYTIRARADEIETQS